MYFKILQKQLRLLQILIDDLLMDATSNINYLKLLTLVSHFYPEKLKDCSRQLWEQFWVKNEPISNEEYLSKVFCLILF